MRTVIKSTVRLSRSFNLAPLFLFSSKIHIQNKTNYTSPFMKNVFMFGSDKAFKNIEKGQFTGPGFYLQQLLTGCLAIYSYYIQSGNDAFLIDPMNETSKYQQIINARGKKLKGVFLTHYHADYIAGHLELKKKYGCEIYLGPKALTTHGIRVMKEGQQIKLGDIKLKVIHTPGHTQESSCLLLIDSANKPQCLFTGDTVFLNEVGRPDLAVKTDLSSADLAGMLYDSLQKIKALSDDIRIYPGHGAGSSCGKSIGTGDFCTLGTQKQNNYGLKHTDKAKFVKQVLHQMPNPPQYFGYNAGVNKFQPFDYDKARTQTMKKLTTSQVKKLIQDGQTRIIDVRQLKNLKEGMIKGSFAIDYHGPFANWAGTVLEPRGNYIIYGPEETAKQSIKRLLRIGYINIKGYLADDIKSVEKDLTVFKPDFVSTVNVQGRKIVDVRKPSEWAKGVAEGDVTKMQLDKDFSQKIKSLDKSQKYVVHCQSGYRARIAYSMMKDQGLDVKVYGEGGYANFEKIGVKTVKK